MKRLIVTTLLLLFSTLSLAADTQIPSVELPPELARVLRDYERAWTAKDAAGLASLFTEDGFVLSNGKTAAHGRDEILKRYADSGGPLALRAMAYSVSGNVGYIIGAYGASKEAGDWGKFILALRKVNGKWLIVADMDNTNQPPRKATSP